MRVEKPSLGQHEVLVAGALDAARSRVQLRRGRERANYVQRASARACVRACARERASERGSCVTREVAANETNYISALYMCVI